MIIQKNRVMKQYLTIYINYVIIILLYIHTAIAQDVEWCQPMKQRLEQITDNLERNLLPWKVPEQIFKVECFGAKGDGQTKNTMAVQRAIDTCSESGGGVVLFSKGDYVTGTFKIKSGVMIEVSEGSRILGSTDIKDYPRMVEEFKSVMSENYHFCQSLIYAEKTSRQCEEKWLYIHIYI